MSTTFEYRAGDFVDVFGEHAVDPDAVVAGTVVSVQADGNGAFPYDVRLENGRVIPGMSPVALRPRTASSLRDRLPDAHVADTEVSIDDDVLRFQPADWAMAAGRFLTVSSASAGWQVTEYFADKTMGSRLIPPDTIVGELLIVAERGWL